VYYSYKNQYPKFLPPRIRLDDGSTRSSLENLSQEELSDLGFSEPITKPRYDDSKQKLEWTGTEFIIVPMTEEDIEEKNQKNIAEKIKNVDYDFFWRRLLDSSFYKRIIDELCNKKHLKKIYVMLLESLSDARSGKASIDNIQNAVNLSFCVIDFSSEEIDSLKESLDVSNLIFLLDIPPGLNPNYDPETNKILKPPPFESWTIKNGAWTAPVIRPKDGKSYRWNESIKNWVEI